MPAPTITARAARLLASAALVVPAVTACVPVRLPDAPAARPAAAAAPVPVRPQEVHLDAKEWSFTPRALQLTAGQPVTVVLDNTGIVEHDVQIPQLGLKLAAAPGTSAQTTFTPSKEGTFEFVCSLPGHKEAGMQGVARVAPANVAPTTPSQAEVAALATSAARVEQGHTSHAASVTTRTKGNQELAYRLEGDVKVFDLTADHVQWEVLPGEMIDAYGYNGQVPGPVLRVTEGDSIKVNLTNHLPEPTVIHFHGPTLPNAMDGVPAVTQDVVQPGASFTYSFTAKPAGTFMYHTHHNSAFQESKGLFGTFIVEPGDRPGPDVEALQILSESGGYFLINGKAFPATEPIAARVGQKVLLRLINLGQMSHPMHLHGHPFKIVATDGHPVPEGMALTKDTVNIGPGERYDLLIEPTVPGTWVFHCHILTHVQNHGEEPGGMITVFTVTE